MRTLFIFFLALSLSPALQAQWSARSLEFAERWNQQPPAFADPFAATVAGSIKSAVDLRGETAMDKVLTAIVLRAFARPLSVALARQPARAPLIVLLPGIFAESDGTEARLALNFLYKLGYHVLVLPNSWSPHAIESGPQTRPGDLEKEASWTLDLIRIVKQKIGQSQVSSTNLVGASYGGFLAAVVIAQDRAGYREIDGGVTLLSPPLDAQKSFAILDALGASTEQFRDDCSGLHIVEIGWRYLHAETESQLGTRALQCAPFLTAASFQVSLRKTIQSLHMQSPRFPTFAWYEQNVAPDIASEYLGASGGRLAYWVRRATSLGFRRFAIILARDDFLSAQDSWNELAEQLRDPARSLILLNFGGHLGYVGTPEVKAIFQATFKDLNSP